MTVAGTSDAASSGGADACACATGSRLQDPGVDGSSGRGDGRDDAHGRADDPAESGTAGADGHDLERPVGELRQERDTMLDEPGQSDHRLRGDGVCLGADCGGDGRAQRSRRRPRSPARRARPPRRRAALVRRHSSAAESGRALRSALAVPRSVAERTNGREATLRSAVSAMA